VGSCIGNDQGHNEEVTSKRENMIRKKKCEWASLVYVYAQEL
jgi:hypothetical protein